MPLLPKFNLLGFGKKKQKPIDKKQMNEALQEALEPYIKRDEINKMLRNIERDKEKRRIWDGLTDRQKIKLLRYAANRRREQSAKR